MRTHRLAIAVGIASACLVACSLITSYDNLVGPPDTTSDDAQSESSTITDANSPPFDGTVIEPDGATLVFNDFSDKSKWTTFDLNAIAPADAGTGILSDAKDGYLGGAFDGKYVYFAPTQGNDFFAAYDTTAAGGLTAASSWSFYSTVSFGNGEFRGAVFDGSYVYFIPGAGASATIARYKLTAGSNEFLNPANWSSFNLNAVIDGGAWRFNSGSFDGTDVYLAPLGLQTFTDGGSALTDHLAVRFNVTNFTKTGYQTFDPATLGGGDLGANGSVWDGVGISYCPEESTHAFYYAPEGGAFTSAGWTAYAYPGASTSVVYGGAAFDGRYVYYAPRGGTQSIMRRDSKGAFDDSASWTIIDGGPNTRFEGAGFDGRYIYFAAENGGNVERYDTMQSFTDPASFEQFDTTTLTPGSNQFGGVIFDGRYIYFVPFQNSIVARFDSRSPSAPPGPPSYGSTM